MIYLVIAEIAEGEHSHRAYATVTAPACNKAWVLAEKYAEGYWQYADNSVYIKVTGVHALSKAEAKMVKDLDIAYSMKP